MAYRKVDKVQKGYKEYKGWASKMKEIFIYLDWGCMAGYPVHAQIVSRCGKEVVALWSAPQITQFSSL